MEQSEKKEGLLETLIKERKLDMGILFCSAILGVFFGWNLIEIAIFLVFIWSIIGPILSRHLMWPALFFLSLTPILLALGRKGQAEEYAIYAYYFLVMAVIRGIIEVRGGKGE